MSRTPLIRVTAMPADTNPYGGVFGGWLMSQMALAAGRSLRATAAARRWWSRPTNCEFPGAPQVGDEISVYADLEKQGRTSLTIAVEAVARERDGDEETKVAQRPTSPSSRSTRTTGRGRSRDRNRING